MAIIVFAVGRPGSGKSTIVRQIMKIAEQEKENDLRNDFSIKHLRDYTILQEMSQKEAHRNKFTKNKFSGFDVIDFTVLDTALEELEVQIKEDINNYDIIFVEFARDTYERAFQKFSSSLLKESLFLFVEAKLEICIERIYNRVKDQCGSDHHFLSDEIMQTYYKEDQWSYMNSRFMNQFSIEEQYFKAVYNMDALEKLEGTSKEFAQILFEKVRIEQMSAVLV